MKKRFGHRFSQNIEPRSPNAVIHIHTHYYTILWKRHTSTEVGCLLAAAYAIIGTSAAGEDSFRGKPPFYDHNQPAMGGGLSSSRSTWFTFLSYGRYV